MHSAQVLVSINQYVRYLRKPSLPKMASDRQSFFPNKQGTKQSPEMKMINEQKSNVHLATKSEQ